jgi:hypothetical protein
MSVIWKERRIEVFDSRSSKKRKLSSIRRSAFALPPVRALDIARPGGNAVARSPSGGYFDFVDVALLLHHAQGWLWKHATSIDTATKRENQIYRNRRPKIFERFLELLKRLGCLAKRCLRLTNRFNNLCDSR